MRCDVHPQGEQDGKERGTERGEKEDDGENEQKLHGYGPDRDQYQRVESDPLERDESGKHQSLKCHQQENNRSESEEFSKDVILSRNRLGEDEVDGTALDFLEQDLSADENHGDEPPDFYHGEPEIHDEALGFPERKAREHQGKTDQHAGKQEDDGKNSVPEKFPEGIYGDIVHVAEYKKNAKNHKRNGKFGEAQAEYRAGNRVKTTKSEVNFEYRSEAYR
jgi:hypothetical protein